MSGRLRLSSRTIVGVFGGKVKIELMNSIGYMKEITKRKSKIRLNGSVLMNTGTLKLI